MNGESYVVRIYKRGPAPARAQSARSAGELVGIVENTLSGERFSFHGVDELWAILARSAKSRKAPRWKPARSGRRRTI
jgi:hypothetical protein